MNDKLNNKFSDFSERLALLDLDYQDRIAYETTLVELVWALRNRQHRLELWADVERDTNANPNLYTTQQTLSARTGLADAEQKVEYSVVALRRHLEAGVEKAHKNLHAAEHNFERASQHLATLSPSGWVQIVQTVENARQAHAKAERRLREFLTFGTVSFT